ncbi:hypothetical protein AGABI2DRAFT_221404 [Agaricus bisporus var. bisporus H97]|uniref:hypothetical protein n=1 Tax=Agaricus bisporus var. bisporus (strain H97 / ATCC MYA-4626 / FGSC 10389) TaxID=936046 RepID=UPI00029F75B7|nr:hypothetical protein AGABI2DRAFT_221404 [Agaricus bisporus var. bisporus H97]EKV47373.1 hypothetical protein AGABI2DRAFT_221404 [Agaricus bisporus var. bisporus H97]
MSGASSKRSSLIDVSYRQLYASLSNPTDAASANQIKEYLNVRKERLKLTANPFGTPSVSSKAAIESGSVTLPDGVVLRIDDAEEEYIYAISEEFTIDEIQALILLRSFFYNEGIPPITSDTSIKEELLEAITPFFRNEKLAALRVLIPLFRAKENSDDILYNVAVEMLPQLILRPYYFIQDLLEEYTRQTKEKLPTKFMNNPKLATSWAKQNLKEQLMLLEVLFWAMWSYVPTKGPLVMKIFETAYSTNLGSIQSNATLLLEEESVQLQQDSAALWILITVEVLELENVAEPESLTLPGTMDEPIPLEKMHSLIMAHDDSQFVCTYLAWTFVLSRAAKNPKEAPLLESISKSQSSKNKEPIHMQMLHACLRPEAGLFRFILSLLTNSPLFVTSVAWKTASWISDPNVIAYRSLLKGLVISLVELIPVEHIPDFDLLVEVWVTLFGRSESQSVAALCEQFWLADWKHGISRRAIFDVARSRFPIQLHPLLRLLRSMTGTGFLDTDPLSTADHLVDVPDDLRDQRDLCSRHVFYYFDRLTSYSQVIPLSACSGSQALYERHQERYGTSHSQGLTYINLKPIKLPGGSVLPARSVGRVISADNSEQLVICWQHQHSGWKLVLELLTDYVNRRRQKSGAYQDISFAPRGNVQTLSLSLAEIGVDFEADDGETLITEALDLVRSLIYDNPGQAEQLMEATEAGDPVVAHTMTEAQPPDLVQLTTMILEEALARTNPKNRTSTRTQLITSAMSVLAAILALPSYSNRVWLYIRSTTALFGSDKTGCFASMALASERTVGHYTMTLSLLYLVQQLFREASVSVLPENQRLQHLKEEVLMRATRFVHTEIWVEHLGWKYTQLGDRFEIGKRISSLYSEILEHAPPTLRDGPFTTLSQTIADALLSKATTSSINPLVSSIASGSHMLRMLYNSRRFSDVRRLVFLLESHLHLSALLLNYKQRSVLATTPCLLEQTLSSRIVGGASSFDSIRGKADPIDVIAGYVKDRETGTVVPLEAMHLLHALLSSLSVSYSSPPTIIGHLNNAEATVASLVRIVEHPFDDLHLRYAIWRFIALAVDKEPALASLFVTGKLRTSIEGKDKEKMVGHGANATDVALDALANWKEVWEANPQLLASVLRFLCVVWEHGLEHKTMVISLRENEDIWNQLNELVQIDVGPPPPHEKGDIRVLENSRHSNAHEFVQSYAYRILSKAYAARIFGLDIDIGVQLVGKNKKPLSLVKLEPCFKDEFQLLELLSEASANAYSPRMYDQLVGLLKDNFSGLVLDFLEIHKPKDTREFGDDYAFNMALYRTRLRAYPQLSFETVDLAEKGLLSINMNLSLSDAQKVIMDSWEFLLQKVRPYIRGDSTSRQNLLKVAESLSSTIAKESRSGEVMAVIHQARLSLLLAVLELAWFAVKGEKEEIDSFLEMAVNVPGIILNEAQSPMNAIIRNSAVPFHRTLLQIIFYCIKQSRLLFRQDKAFKTEQRVSLASFVEVALHFIIEALRIVFTIARSRLDADVDWDMELLVSIFDQGIRSDINPSPTFWLVKCQETDVIRMSLDLYSHIDLVGLTDLSLLHARKRPLYAPHLLQFHMALARSATAAERLASEGVLTAYSNNFISSAISSGHISVVLPELPGERSPAHVAYCSMIAVVAAIFTALGRHNHYFDADVCGFVQLYGEQFAQALRWTIGDPILFPLLEETEQVVHLFYAVAANSPSTQQSKPAMEKISRFFTTHALNLLQQLNYAIDHPNHLASMLEPVTADERSQLEKEKPSTDPLQRPLVMQLLHRLFRLSSNILGTLIVISKADSVLLKLKEEWPIQEALIVPHSKVVLGEPASLGTLLELGNCTLDLLRDLVNRPPNQSITTLAAKTAPSAEPLDVRQSVITARRNLEGILTYAVTQLVMWLSKPEFGPSATNEMEIETDSSVTSMDVTVRADTSLLKDRTRTPSARAMTMAERLRRGMTSEMASDLKELLTKSKPIVAKSATIVGQDATDIIQVLINFLQDHVIYTA